MRVIHADNAMGYGKEIKKKMQVYVDVCRKKQTESGRVGVQRRFSTSSALSGNSIHSARSLLGLVLKPSLFRPSRI